jgi:molybdate transport system substrate-binding protein
VKGAAAALAALVLLAAGCGGGRKLTVYAASSLTEVFQKLDPHARFDFAGSDDLAFQIEQGAGADVYAAADMKYPRALNSKGLVERPQVFARNRLVLIVPRSNPAHVRSLNDLRSPHVKLVLTAPGVPAGDYARKVMAAYCGGRAGCLHARTVSEEPDVKGVVAKVALDEADAGFVYATDARAAASKVREVNVPASLQPSIEYGIAVVKHARHRGDAGRFVELVLGTRGRAALEDAGFGLP